MWRIQILGSERKTKKQGGGKEKIYGKPAYSFPSHLFVFCLSLPESWIPQSLTYYLKNYGHNSQKKSQRNKGFFLKNSKIFHSLLKYFKNGFFIKNLFKSCKYHNIYIYIYIYTLESYSGDSNLEGSYSSVSK